MSGRVDVARAHVASPWRRLCEHDWLLSAVLAFLEDGGDEVHWLWLLALDDGLTSLRARLEQHWTVSVSHARRLAMAHSLWTLLLQLTDYATSTRGRRLTKETIDVIEEELAQQGVEPHPDRRAALQTAVRVDHKTGARRPSVCPTCRRNHWYRCHAGFERCTAPGTDRGTPHFCAELSPNVMYAAARDGRLESVVWLHYVVCYDQEKALALAAKNGHTEVVIWLLNHAHRSTIQVDFRYHDDDELRVMCWHGRRTLQYYTVTNEWGLDQKLGLYMPVYLAAQRGDVDFLRRLSANPFFRAYFTHELMLYAASSGYVPMLELLMELCPQLCKHTFAMWSALERGHLDVARWLVANDCGTSDQESNVRPAIRSGRLDVLQWLVADARDPAVLVREMLLCANECTNQRTLEWLVREHGLTLTTSTHAKAAIARNDTALVKWIVSHCTATTPLSDGSELLDAVIETDNLELVRWFVEELGVWSPNAFALASLGRSEAMVAYIYEISLAQSPPHGSSTPLCAVKPRRKFDLHCLETVAWLLDHQFRSGLFESGALDEVLRIERAHAAAQCAMGTNPVTIRPESMRRFRDLICRLIKEYDPEYMRRLRWLPLWTARHVSLDALQRAVEMDDANQFTRKRFDKLLCEPVRESVVKWILEGKPTLFSTLVVRWAVNHGKRGVLKWIFETFIPTQAQLLDEDPTQLVRKCVRTALWYAHRGSRLREDVLASIQEWTPVANDRSLWSGIETDDSVRDHFAIA